MFDVSLRGDFVRRHHFGIVVFELWGEQIGQEHRRLVVQWPQVSDPT
jgi:hypothetical protein